MSATGKPAVAEVYGCYLERSETFMYSYLAALDQVRPVVVSRLAPINLEAFPCPGEMVNLTPRRYSLLWLRRRITRLIFGKALEEQRAEFCASVLRARGVRLLHAHYGPLGHWCLPIRERLGVPLVTTFYGYDAAPQLSNLPKWPEYRTTLFAKGDLFLVEGPAFRERLIKLGCPPEKVAIQRIAIRMRECGPKRYNKVPVLLFAGRFVEKKGLIYALQAIALLRKAGRKLEFRVIGDGPLRDDLVRFTQENGLEECVSFLGFLNYDEYLRELRGADLFLHPSVVAANGDTEGGAPTVILEAQACGVPVVSTVHADIPYIVTPEQAALLAPERDPDKLAEIISKLLDDESLRAKLAEAGARFVAERHNIAREVRELEQKYFGLMKANAIMSGPPSSAGGDRAP